MNIKSQKLFQKLHLSIPDYSQVEEYSDYKPRVNTEGPEPQEPLWDLDKTLVPG